MSVNNDDEGENSGGVQEFFEFDEDGSSNQTKFELASQPPSDNPKRSSFVEKKRRISSENTGEVDSEIEENIVSISNLNNVKSTSDVAEEKYYDDIDKEWESEITPNELPNDEVELKVTQPQRHTSGSDFIHEEVEEELEFTSKSTPLRTEKEAAIVEVEIEEEITKPSPSPTRGDVVANVEMEDFPEIGDEIAPPKQIADLQARDNNASKAPSADLHSDLIQESRGSSGRCGSDSEHKKVKTSAAELADEAERQALAAGLAADKEKEDKVAALRLRAAKRQEDKEKREKKEFLKQQRKRAREAAAEGAEQEGAPEESEGVEGDAGNTEGKGEELKNKPFLPNINSRVKKTATNASKNRIASADTEDAEVKEASGWNDDVKADASRERQEAAVQQRLKDKEERNKLLRARRAKAQQAQAEGQGQEQGANGGAGGEDAPVESQSLLAPKPPAGRALTKQPASSSSSTAGNHKSRTDRMGRKVSGVSSASADDDPGRVVLPHLTNHPRSSPSPDPRAALHSLLQETEQMGADMDMNGIADDNKSYVSSSNKGRRKKPLYLRMIAKAQQQYLEDERQKHELYSEQKKSKQRGNPTAEELRAHRQKHDELVRAKQEEGRRALAETAAANARALKRQQAVASVVQSALEEGRAGEGDPLVVDGASPLRKQKQSQRKGKAKNKSKGKEEGDASSITLPVLNSHSRTGGPGSDTHDNGFSPKKGSSSSLRHSESKEQSPNPSRSPSSSGRKMHSPNKFDDEGDDSAKANLFPVSTPSRSPDTQRAEGGAGSGRDQQMSPQKPRPAVSTRSVGTDTGTDEPPLLPSPALAATTVVVPLEFDKEAAAAAVQRIPDLSNDALTAFCAPDWINIFSAMDDLVLVPVLVPGSRDRNKSTSRDRSRDDGASGSEGGAPAPASVSAVVGGAHMYVKGIILGQAPPSLDAQKLMFIADQPFP